MNIEESIKGIIEAKLEDGTVEKLISENLEKGINKALESLLSNYGDITKLIENKIKDVMVNQLNTYDYSKYIVKLDDVLTDILKHTSLDNKKILDNFKSLMTDVDIPKSIKVSEIFEKYCDYVAKNVDCNNLEINYDDGASYENVEVNYEISEEEKKSWSTFTYANLFFECPHDDELNYHARLTNWGYDGKWTLSIDQKADFNSLRHLDEFTIYLMKLSQNRVKIEIDTWNGEEEVTPEKEPELTYR